MKSVLFAWFRPTMLCAAFFSVALSKYITLAVLKFSTISLANVVTQFSSLSQSANGHACGHTYPPVLPLVIYIPGLVVRRQMSLSFIKTFLSVCECPYTGRRGEMKMNNAVSSISRE